MSAGVSYAGMAFNFEIMKNLFCLCILLLIGSMQMSRASDKIEKQPLKVLYVGGSADIQVLNETISDSTALRKSIADRTAAFGEMLRQYFQTVKVVAAEDWTPEMSRAYDVTVMDGRPKAIKPAWQEKDASGKVIAYHSAVYLPESFDRPMVTIAEVGNTVGRGIGLKSDWYCLCLDADAHHWRAEHPIFKGPFPVKMTVRMCPTPSDAFHYAYFMDEPVPDSVLMWKVQNKGYQTHEGFRVGMVARPWGFEDSPDAEYISSGVCAKTLDAVAIGRHGNFLHWGFAASPADMTEEAKTVFANAIVYISRFAGQKPFVRKYNDRIATREYVKEQLYLSTREAWQERVKSDEEFAITVNGMTYTDKKDGGAALIAAVKDAKSIDREKVGRYCGFDLYGRFDVFENGFRVFLQGKMEHILEISSDPHGMITRLNNCMASFDRTLTEAEEALADTCAKLETAKTEVTKEFDKEDILSEKLKRLSFLNAQLDADRKETPQNAPQNKQAQRNDIKEKYIKI